MKISTLLGSLILMLAIFFQCCPFTAPSETPTPDFTSDNDWIRCEASAVNSLTTVADVWAGTGDETNQCLLNDSLRDILLAGHRQHRACSPPSDERLLQARDEFACVFASWLRGCSRFKSHCASPDQTVLKAAVDDYSQGNSCLAEAGRLLLDYADAPLGH